LFPLAYPAASAALREASSSLSLNFHDKIAASRWFPSFHDVGFTEKGATVTCLLDDIDVISSIGLVEDAIVKLEVEGTSGFVKLGPLTAEAEIGFVLADIPVLVVVGVVGMIEMLLGW
jgi:hypothetical protein